MTVEGAYRTGVRCEKAAAALKNFPYPVFSLSNAGLKNCVGVVAGLWYVAHGGGSSHSHSLFLAL